MEAPQTSPSPLRGDLGAAPAADRRDRISLTGIGAVGYHGVLDQERRAGQPFFVDTTLYRDLSAAAGSDDLSQTVNYAEVAETVKAVLVGDSVNLIETLAGTIARDILDRFPVDAVEVTVHKPKAPIEVTFADVSVTVYRERD